MLLPGGACQAATPGGCPGEQREFLSVIFLDFFGKLREISCPIINHAKEDLSCVSYYSERRGPARVQLRIIDEFDHPADLHRDILSANAVKGGPNWARRRRAAWNGHLVPDDLIMDIMEVRMKEPDCQKGFLLDGFPRTIPQAEALKKLLEKIGMKLDAAINLDVPTDVILDRLTTRRTCSNPDCQEIYNIKSKPRYPTDLLQCGFPAVQRGDEWRRPSSRDLRIQRKDALSSILQKKGF
jgi:adenylate kinase